MHIKRFPIRFEKTCEILALKSQSFKSYSKKKTLGGGIPPRLDRVKYPTIKTQILY